MLKEIFYAPFYSKTRDILILKSIDVIKRGKRVVYVLPSREAMFDVRDKFITYNGGITDTDIFGFEDLEKQICGDFIKDYALISSYEIREILRNILHKTCDNAYYEKVKGKAGFVKSVLSFIKVIKRKMINPNELKSIADSIDRPTLKDKLKNLAYFYEFYEEYKIKRKLIDVDDISIKAVELFQNTNYFNNVGLIVVDGFINIDYVNMKLIGEMAKSNRYDIYINIPFKNEFNESFIRNGIIKDLCELGFNVNNDIYEMIEVNHDVKKVATYIYSGETVLNGEDLSIKIMNSPSIEHEVRETARLIKRKIVFDKINPDRIAVFIKNIDDYRTQIIDIFDEMNIPVKINRGIKLSTMPITNDIYNLISYKLNHDYESFVNIMTSKFLVPYEISKRSREIINLLSGIDRDKDNFEDEFVTAMKDNESLNATFEFLKRYVDVFINFREVPYKDTKEFVESMLKVIELLEIDFNIKALFEMGIIRSSDFISNVKALETIKQILNKELEIKKQYGEPSIDDIENFQNDILDMLSNFDVSIRNLDFEGVRIISPDLARGQMYDVVFILGVNEGVLPSTKSINPIFDLSDEEYLEKHGIYMLSRKWEFEREKVRFNACIASALKEVYVSYRTTDEDGCNMIKSPFIDDLQNLFDEKSKKRLIAPIVYMKDRFAFECDAASKDEALLFMIDSKWNKRQGDANTIYSNILENDLYLTKSYSYINFSASIEKKRRANCEVDNHMGIISKDANLKELSDIHLSASSLNSYVVCPFKFFIETLLNLHVSDEFIESKKSIGSLYHEVLMKYYKDNLDLYDVNEDRLGEIIDESFEKITGIENDIIFDKIKQEFYNVVFQLVKDDISNRLYYYNKTGAELIPSIFEKKFEMKDHYGGNIFHGKIDRIDLERNIDGKFTGKYVIYDYKSGGIDGIRQCIEGLDFQLPTYYMAVENILKEEFNIEYPKCLGLLYYSIEKVKRNGIVLALYKKDLFKGNSGPRDVVGENNFNVIIDWIEKKGIENIDKIKTGIFNLPDECPFENSSFNCAYKSICRYDKYAMERGENSVV